MKTCNHHNILVLAAPRCGIDAVWVAKRYYVRGTKCLAHGEDADDLDFYLCDQHKYERGDSIPAPFGPTTNVIFFQRVDPPALVFDISYDLVDKVGKLLAE